MTRCWAIPVLVFAGLMPSRVEAQEWVYDAFGSVGSYYNANQHSIPQGAGGYNYSVPQSPPVSQPQGVYQPQGVRQPQPYQYNVAPQAQGPVHLNPQLTNPNNFYHLQAPPPPPPPPVYVAPPVYRAPVVTGFRRR